MPRVPCQKGTSVLPVILALKNHPDWRRLVPEDLHKYFDQHLVISSWYPERDYWVLIEALVKTLDPAVVGPDPWRYFARFSAKKDIGGGDAKNGKGGGVYRNFAAGDASDPDNFFRRVIRLWSQYHDSGTMEVRGGREAANSVVLRLVGFEIPIDGFVRLQGYYMEEFGKLIGLPLQAKVMRSTARGDRHCQWEATLERTERTTAYVTSLPNYSE